MAWIQEIDEKNAGDKLSKIFQEIQSKRGKISNIMRVQSLNPKAMQLHLDLYVHLMFGKSPLSRFERELIGVIVSQSNNCNYCIAHHLEALRHHMKDESFLQELEQNTKDFNKNNPKYTLITYVQKLTLKPNKISKKDIDLLHTEGYSDQAILDIGLITSYFNFVNRLVLGLGVEVQTEEIKGYQY